ncbi:hypothetical protein BDV97DRAFT_397140 [Delphinella strobiligena]|nr:hypothetical protein BDV97DRAFT_397140 [Delphinella strobiligena]
MALREPPKVDHFFDGSELIQKSTLDRRMRIRELIIALQNDVQDSIGVHAHVEVSADIKINTSHHETREHMYRVHVQSFPTPDNQAAKRPSSNNTASDDTNFHSARGHSSASDLSPTDRTGIDADANVSAMTSGKPRVGGGFHETSKAQAGVNPRPNKRPRASGTSSMDLTAETLQSAPSRSASFAYPQTHVKPLETSRPAFAPQVSTTQLRESPTTGEETIVFLEDWRKQWHSQGGWLFDLLTKMSNEEQRQSSIINEKLDSLQSTIPIAHNQLQAGMREISQDMLPWLEKCRKTAGDASQAREEKWRISSANFHDQTRREREAAEKAMLREIRAQSSALNKQMKMVKKLLDAQNLVVNEDGVDDESIPEKDETQN